jgi:hypothetical protein
MEAIDVLDIFSLCGVENEKSFIITDMSSSRYIQQYSVSTKEFETLKPFI